MKTWKWQFYNCGPHFPQSSPPLFTAPPHPAPSTLLPLAAIIHRLHRFLSSAPSHTAFPFCQSVFIHNSLPHLFLCRETGVHASLVRQSSTSEGRDIHVLGKNTGCYSGRRNSDLTRQCYDINYSLYLRTFCNELQSYINWCIWMTKEVVVAHLRLYPCSQYTQEYYFTFVLYWCET
jgi:hypothetical protein